MLGANQAVMLGLQLDYVPDNDGSAYDFDCDSLSGYTPNIGGTGAVSQITYKSESVIKCSTGTGSGSDYGFVRNDTAYTPYSIDDYPVISARLEINSLEPFSAGSGFVNLVIAIDTARLLNFSLYSDVIRYKDYNNVTKTFAYTPIYDEGSWLEVRTDKSVTPWKAEILIDGVTQATGIEVGQPGATAGRVEFGTYSTTTTMDVVAHFDKIKIGGAA